MTFALWDDPLWEALFEWRKLVYARHPGAQREGACVVGNYVGNRLYARHYGAYFGYPFPMSTLDGSTSWMVQEGDV